MKTKIYTSLVASLLLISGCTTYHSAAAKGNVKAIDRLHAEGVDINEFDSSGLTALIHAVILNQKEGVLGLLNAGANVNVSDDILNDTPLHYAISQGNVFLVRLFVQNGADLSLRNKDGISAIDLAQRSRNEEIKRLILIQQKRPEVAKKQEIKVMEAVKVESVVPLAVIKPSIIERKSSEISESEARAVLNRLMSKHETLAIRTFLNEHPQMITLISDPKQQLRYIGPSAWRIMDIAEQTSRGVLKEQEVIDHIQTSALPYKKFTEDEVRIISHYGISNKIINAMISVTH